MKQEDYPTGYEKEYDPERLREVTKKYRTIAQCKKLELNQDKFPGTWFGFYAQTLFRPDGLAIFCEPSHTVLIDSAHRTFPNLPGVVFRAAYDIFLDTGKLIEFPLSFQALELGRPFAFQVRDSYGDCVDDFPANFVWGSMVL